MQMRNVWRVMMFGIVGLTCATAQAQVPVQPPGMPGGVVVPPRPPSVDVGERSKREPPFVVRVGGTEAPAPRSTVQVRVTIERKLLDSTPLRLEVQLPEGVELAKGQLTEEIVDAQTPVVTRTIELRVGAEIPSDDVVVTVSQRGEGWGGTAEHRYRFGRPAPEASPAPLRRGPPVELGNGIIVRPIIVN